MPDDGRRRDRLRTRVRRWGIEPPPEDSENSDGTLEAREFLVRLFKMAFALWIAFLFVGRPVHELGHYMAASALGVAGSVRGSAFVLSADGAVPAGAWAIIAVSGGLSAALALSLASFIVRPPYRTGILPLIAAELAYAPFDGTTIGLVTGSVAMTVVLGGVASLFALDFLRPRQSRDSTSRPPWRSDDPMLADRTRRFRECLSEFHAFLDGGPGATASR